MAIDKRHERMLEELLKVPGNETCADCHAIAPRWASVNLGIFICMSCASVHRKLGTHKSRVKSVTMDSWTREQIASMREIGNTRSNAIFNPNEALHPPPTATGSEDRDSEIEKYIRRKYEQEAFKPGVSGSRHAPTSLNRAREVNGRIPSGSMTDRRPFPTGRNNSNPELNDVLVVTSPSSKDRDLPALPAARGDAMPRPRPSRSPSGTDRPATAPGIRPLKQNPFGITPSGSAMSMQLIDFEGAPTATRPLQVTAQDNQFGSGNPFGQQSLAPSAMPNSSQPSPNVYSNGLQPPNPFYHAGQFDSTSQSFQTPAPSPFRQPQQPLQHQSIPPFQHQPNSFPPPAAPNPLSGLMSGQPTGANGQGYGMNGFPNGINRYNSDTAGGFSNNFAIGGSTSYPPLNTTDTSNLPYGATTAQELYDRSHASGFHASVMREGMAAIDPANRYRPVHGGFIRMDEPSMPNGMNGMSTGAMNGMNGGFMSGVNGGMNGLNGGGMGSIGGMTGMNGMNGMNGISGMNGGGFPQTSGFNPWAGEMSNGHGGGYSNGMR